MRIPTSSSILLATLAISSSSTCLAAPTGDTPQDGISAGSSHVSSMEVPRSYPEGIPIYERDVNTDTLLNDLLGQPLNVVGATLGRLLSNLVSTGTVNGLEPQDLDKLQNAAAQITAVFNGTLANSPAPAPVKGAAGAIVSNTPLGTLSDNGASSDSNSGPASPSMSMSSSATYPTAAAAAADDSTTSGSSASHAPPAASPSASPPMPANPPNTPSLPVNV